MTTQLYRHFDNTDTLLYVGVSLSAVNRLSQHRCGSPWFSSIAKVTVVAFPSREEALKAERVAIKNERPLYNKAHSLPIEDKTLGARAVLCRRGFRAVRENGVLRLDKPVLYTAEEHRKTMNPTRPEARR